jgi:hypothetical protein
VSAYGYDRAVREQLDAVLAAMDETRPAARDALMGVFAPTLRRLRRERDTARSLLDTALNIRMYGERAPGGNENWRDWERDVSAYLYPETPGGKS